MAKPVVTIVRASKIITDASSHVDVRLDECYSDGNPIHEFLNMGIWGADPALLAEYNQLLSQVSSFEELELLLITHGL